MKIETVACLGLMMLLVGCVPSSPREVVVYCALDKEFSQPILDEFQAKTGIKVLPKFDQESNKTVGLAEEILQQSENQRCDVFWNNEILHTLRLKKAGLLVPFSAKESSEYASQFVSRESDWYGFAARARVILVNTEKLRSPKDYPDSLLDFIDPKWQGECAIAKPLFGTTATHASVLYSKWGEEKAGQFFDRLKENAAIENGNKQVAVKVSQGVYAFGLTDTDDAIIEIEQGYPVAIVFPDQSEEEQGALLIPNTLSITGGPNPKEAKQLIKYLLTRAIEEKLAEGASAQIPLHRKAHIRSRVEPEDLRVMEVDFAAAAEAWENVKSELAEKFPL